jgi:hypothetical protein
MEEEKIAVTVSAVCIIEPGWKFILTKVDGVARIELAESTR